MAEAHYDNVEHSTQRDSSLSVWWRRLAVCSPLVAVALIASTQPTFRAAAHRRSELAQTRIAVPGVMQASSLEMPVSPATPAGAVEVETCLDADVPPEQVVSWLRTRPFNTRTENTLRDHPVVRAAAAGTMSLEVVRLVLKEEYYIEDTDLRSMALAISRSRTDASISFFKDALESESVARSKLSTMAEGMGITDVDLKSYMPMPAAHAYTAELTEIAAFHGTGALAAAFAVNFPAWGRMCGRLADGLVKNYGMSEEDVGFLRWFAAPLPDDYDEQATAVITDSMQAGETLCGIERAVRLLQGYEVMFWDAVWSKAQGGIFVTLPLNV